MTCDDDQISAAAGFDELGWVFDAIAALADASGVDALVTLAAELCALDRDVDVLDLWAAVTLAEVRAGVGSSRLPSIPGDPANVGGAIHMVLISSVDLASPTTWPAIAGVLAQAYTNLGLDVPLVLTLLASAPGPAAAVAAAAAVTA